MEEEKLLSYIQGNLSEEENLKVEEWAGRSAEHRRLLEQMCYVYSLSQQAEAYQTVDEDAAWHRFTQTVHQKEKSAEKVRLDKYHRSWWHRYGMAVAAFLAGLVFASGILLGIYGEGSTYEVSTAAGQRARVVLPDGSSAWLNASTKLAYESDRFFGQRTVTLNGEAYFEVKKKSFKPFIVSSQGINTKVLGTKFNVRAREGECKVVTTLLQGSVQMSCVKAENKVWQLKPGETVSVDANSLEADLYRYSNPEEILLWIKGDLHFKDQSLGQIMDSLAKIYNVKVKFTHPRLKEKRFTCLFKTDSSLEDILSTLAMTRHFSYQIDESTVWIKTVD